jgi:branched-subunit amino acid aminotransferase/4-amino-4-deoxychorismate lyase
MANRFQRLLNGFDDAIVWNQDGHVAEGRAATFMMVRRVAITPPVTANLLEGDTPRSLVTLMHEELAVEVMERETTVCMDKAAPGLTHRLRGLFYRVLRG